MISFKDTADLSLATTQKEDKICFQNWLSFNAGQKYCRMLQGEHFGVQPYILVSKQKKTKTKFLRCTGNLNYMKTIKQDLLLILVLVRQLNFLNC